MTTAVYYIYHRELTFPELKEYYDTIPSLIHVVFSPDEVTIVDLKSVEKNKGMASRLIQLVCLEAVERNIKKIVVDDCSNRYRKSRNIYTKMGMKYINEDGPEMEGDTLSISSLRLTRRVFDFFFLFLGKNDTVYVPTHSDEFNDIHRV